MLTLSFGGREMQVTREFERQQLKFSEVTENCIKTELCEHPPRPNPKSPG